MKGASGIPSVDEPYTSPELARAALLAPVPGVRDGRSPDIADRLVRAARRGIDQYHRDVAAFEYFSYLKKVESAVANLEEPSFSDPEVAPENPPSELWKDRDEYQRSARQHYDLVTATVQARLRVFEKFGERAVARAFEKPRERMKFYMVLSILRDAFDARYDPPAPAELALLAVVHRVDDPIRSRHDPDSSDVRRKRWQYTLTEAKRMFDQELGVSPPSS